jgi:hypothetical protein
MPKPGPITVAEVMAAAGAVAVYAARRMVFNRSMRNRDDDLATIDLRC